MTRSKKLIILLIALGAVICVFFIVSGISSSYNASLTDETIQLFSMESTDEAASVSWVYDGETISFSKTDDIWEYTEDSEFPVDEDALLKLLKKLVSVTSSKTIENPDDISQYGLDEPVVTVNIASSDSNAQLAFGDPTNITGEYYCSNGDGNVYLVDSTIADAFCVDSMSLVEKEDIPSMKSTNSFKVTNPDGTYEFEYIEDSGIVYSDEYVWFYNDNGKYTAVDNELFNTYLNAATGVSFISCVSYDATDNDLAEYGLDNPAVKFTVNYTRTEEVETDEIDEDGNKIYETNEYIEDFDLDIGNYDGDYCYARIPGSNMIYQINASVEDTYLNSTVVNLLPDDIIKMDWDELTSFDVIIDDVTYTIEHEMKESEDDTEISVYTYDDEELDGVDSVLSSLYSLTSEERTDSSSDGKDLILSFIFYRNNNEYPKVTLDFYKYDSSTYLVELNGESTVLVSGSSVDSISDDLITCIEGEDEDEGSD